MAAPTAITRTLIALLALFLSGCLFMGEGLVIFGIENDTASPAQYQLTWQGSDEVFKGELEPGGHNGWTSGIGASHRSDSMVKSVKALRVRFADLCQVELTQAELYPLAMANQYHVLFSDLRKRCPAPKE